MFGLLFKFVSKAFVNADCPTFYRVSKRFAVKSLNNLYFLLTSELFTYLCGKIEENYKNDNIMGKLFKFIESAIFEQEETTQQEPEKTTGAPVSHPKGGTTDPASKTIEAPSGAVGGASPSGAAGGASYAGNIRRHFAELISESVELADIPGPDYRELKDAFDTEEMKQNIPDPTTRWRTCFSMMRMMNKGLTKKNILDSIDVYTGVVDNEKKNALAQIEEKYNELVGKKGVAVAEAEKRIKDAEADITRLQEKINKIIESISGDRTFIETAKAEIAAGEAEIKTDRADLEMTAETIKKALTDDKATLEAILPNDQ